MAGRSRSAHGRWVMGHGQTSPPVWMLGSGHTRRWGMDVPGLRADRTQRGHGGRRTEPFGGNPAGRRWEDGMRQSQWRRQRQLPDARRRRWCGLQRRRQWCARSPLGGPTPGRAAQSSTLRQRLPETPRSRSGYPPRPVAGCRPRGLGVRHPATAAPGKGAPRAHGARRRDGERRAEPAGILPWENGCRAGMTRPAWGVCAADRLVA